jgi:hypothetical protein
MMKRADSACSVDRLVWRKFIELLHAHFPGPVSSRVLKTLGFLAAAVVSAEICSHASAPDGSDNFPPDKVLATTEILTAPAAATSVSVVPKMPRSPVASQDAPVGLDVVMSTACSEQLLLCGENVPSMMLMTKYSLAPAATATATAVTPCAVTPKPKLKPKPAVQPPPAVQEPQTKLSWWRRLPWVPLP